jgi:prephenate dehydrogenase
MFIPLLVSSGVRVTSVDIGSQSTGQDIEHVRFQQGDITKPSGEVARLVADADIVLLAVPEPVALDAVTQLASIMRPGALLADTLSVKSRIASLVRKEAQGLEAISLNPMFNPSLGLAGRPVAAVVLMDGPRTQALCDLLTVWGAKVVPITAEDHDRLTATIQALTHSTVLAFGFALRELHPNVEQLRLLATPPLIALLSLLSRVTSGVPDVYWDIQIGNPKAAAARAELQKSIDHLAALALANDEGGFFEMFEETRDFLVKNLEHLPDVSARVFETVASSALTGH